MKLMYVTSRKARLLITGILLLGCLAIGQYDYGCCKKGNLEKVVVICRLEAEEELYVWHFTADEDLDVIE